MNAAAAVLVVPTAEEQLAALRRAWLTKNAAEANLARLRTYSHHTAGMKDAADRSLRQLRDANDTLQRVLGVAA